MTTTRHDCTTHHPHDCPNWVDQVGEASADYCGCQCGHCESWMSLAVDCVVCGATDDTVQCEECGETVCATHR